jgi:serine/threonine protein kinase
MLSSGTKLGPYEIRRLLGAGGMGEVYCAHDPRLGREVAIKVLSTNFGSSESAIERFQRIPNEFDSVVGRSWKNRRKPATPLRVI